MKLVIGGDHAGFSLKAKIVRYLQASGHEVMDVGTHSEEPVDFPDIAKTLCSKILGGEAERGIMVCGTGVGASIAANKIPGIRAPSATMFTRRTNVLNTTMSMFCVLAPGSLAKSWRTTWSTPILTPAIARKKIFADGSPN